MFALVLIATLFSSFFNSIGSPVLKERLEDKLQQIDVCAQTGCQR